MNVEPNVELWEPASVPAPRVGDRVRVRVSPECAYHSGLREHVPDLDYDGHDGVVVFDLREGIPPFVEEVEGALRAILAASHVLVVTFERSVARRADGVGINAGEFAPAELEVIDHGGE